MQEQGMHRCKNCQAREYTKAGVVKGACYLNNFIYKFTIAESCLTKLYSDVHVYKLRI